MECRLNYLNSFAFLWFFEAKERWVNHKRAKDIREPQEIRKGYMVAGLIYLEH